MAAHLTKSVLRSAVYPVQWMGMMMWNDSEKEGDVKSECEEDEDADCVD
jgi:hypothetical protein